MNDIISDVVQELLREALSKPPFAYGSGAVNTVGFPESVSGIAVQLTPLGVQLLLWAHGVNREIQTRFFAPELELSMPGMPPLEEGALVLADLTQPPKSDVSESEKAG